MTLQSTRRWPDVTVKPSSHGAAPLQVGMLTFPGLTLLDLLGPQTVLHGPTQTHLIWKSTAVLDSDSGIGIQPNMTFREAPDRFDILFVPGGPGQMDVFRDSETLEFLLERGERATWVTSVCTGSLILGAAGLLKGYRATSHWAALELLTLFGAVPVAERVVVDRNRITGGGVTAGIDFGLHLLRLLFGEEVAKTTQLLMEYDPAPPFNAGNVAGAGQDIATKAMEVIAPAAEGTMAAIEHWSMVNGNLP